MEGVAEELRVEGRAVKSSVGMSGSRREGLSESSLRERVGAQQSENPEDIVLVNCSGKSHGDTTASENCQFGANCQKKSTLLFQSSRPRESRGKVN